MGSAFSHAVTDSLRYDAFGNVMNRTGTTPTPFGFVGASQYQTDADSGLQLLGHRYYDPSIGRFLSQDPIQDGTNWYAYCDNNPLTGVDAEGLDETIIHHNYPGLEPPSIPIPWVGFPTLPRPDPIKILPPSWPGVGGNDSGNDGNLPKAPGIPSIPGGTTFPIPTDGGVGTGTIKLDPKHHSGGVSGTFPIRPRPGKDPIISAGGGIYFPGKGKIDWGIGAGVRWGPVPHLPKDPMEPGPF